MNSNGGFHQEVEENGTISLVYHHPIFQSIPQTQNPTSNEAVIDDLQPLFLCPISRLKRSDKKNPDGGIIPITCSPNYIGSTTISDEHEGQDLSNGFTDSDDDEDHPTLPLFWCNDKEFDTKGGGCVICRGSHYATDYFFCDKCDSTSHKECVQSPSIIKHPYHPDHSLHLFYRELVSSAGKCLYCGRDAWYGLVYYCSRCDVFMHTVCVMKWIPFVVDQPKSHDHSLTLFAKLSLTCNVCGLIRDHYPTYICLKCSFAAHKDCMYAPHIIKISRHQHRIHYTSSLPTKELFCGVCRKSIDGVFGAYTCDKRSDYVVHTRCALREDICDGVELEGIPEEADISLDAKPFEIVSEGVILHFLHDHHHLQLEVNILYDEKKICEVCVMPIDEGNFYSCTACEFILHETCAKSPRRLQHALHPHPLTFKAQYGYSPNFFICNACDRYCKGFVYQCPLSGCKFYLDVRCASISEPFVFQGHDHPLFLALPPEAKPICVVCKKECYKQFNCIKCDFIVCFMCASLPYNAKYKHDKHLLTLVWGKEVCEKDWCEICERNLGDTKTISFYWCNDCCTTLHIGCLFDDAFVKAGQIIKVRGKEFTILRKKSLSRPLCDHCKYPCQGRIYSGDCRIACSVKCVFNL